MPPSRPQGCVQANCQQLITNLQFTYCIIQKLHELSKQVLWQRFWLDLCTKQVVSARACAYQSQLGSPKSSFSLACQEVFSSLLPAPIGQPVSLAAAGAAAGAGGGRAGWVGRRPGAGSSKNLSSLLLKPHVL
jgi:hypothetical protein